MASSLPCHRGYLLLLSVCLIWLTFSEAIFIELMPGEQTCFLLYSREDHIHKVEYTLETPTDNPAVYKKATSEYAVAVEVFNEDWKNILKRSYRESGKITMTAEETDRHHICFKAADKYSLPRRAYMRLHLSFMGADDERSFVAMSKDKKLDLLLIEGNYAKKKLDLMQKYILVHKYREQDFRHVAYSVNSYSFYWSIALLPIFIAMGLYQYWHLKSFFIKKKLV